MGAVAMLVPDKDSLMPYSPYNIRQSILIAGWGPWPGLD
jgi:hypothetical protein